MFAFLYGTIDEIQEGNVVVNCNGLGFNVSVSNETASRLSMLSSSDYVKIYTYTQVREDQFSLYGFLSRDELRLYRQLITVSGLGPKSGLSLLSAMPVDDLKFAIVTGDTASISKAPGIGKKTAERIVVELRDKLSRSDDFVSGISLSQDAADGLSESADSDAVEALCALGYTRMDARRAVSKATNEGAKDTESILKASLKYLY
ncbi:MAG: Holliday junction branch migration protein RuvA [Lachnospiraceae bacterium]|nr:Holliday junction branch migration protein RuvA [Lachnospiraceae bacterium]